MSASALDNLDEDCGSYSAGIGYGNGMGSADMLIRLAIRAGDFALFRMAYYLSLDSRSATKSRFLLLHCSSSRGRVMLIDTL